MSAPHENPNRRDVLRAGAGIGAGAAALALGSAVSPLGSSAVASAAPRTAQQVFAHGVASGDPLPDRVVLWTRVTPSAQATPGSGRGAPVPVTWTVAADAAFSRIVASGSTTAGPDTDFTVKVDPAGLSADTVYHYRFAVTLDGQVVTSPAGRTRTAPAAGADVSRIRFGVVSCANWEAGYFGAYRHLAAQPDLTAVVHLGDYLYEYGTGGYTGKGGPVRVHEPRHDITDLADYRIRHAQYKTDPDLRTLHLKVPFICTWDDHESANDAWSGGAENHSRAQGDWAARRDAAYRAYSEWMPVRAAVDAGGRHLYRRLRFGKLLELSMLDLRTYRDEQVSPTSRSVSDPNRSITGAAQMRWLRDGLTSSTTRWRIIGNPVMISPVLIPPLDPANAAAITELLGLPSTGVPYNADQWDGYTADRQRLIETLRDDKVDNVVFITGDIHSSWACDLPVNAANYPGGGTVATELVTPSVTSSNIDDILGVPENTVGATVPTAIMAANNHIRWNDFDAHGYAVLTVTAASTQMDWFFVRDKTDPRTGQFHAKSFRIASGSPHVRPVSAPVR